MRFRYQEPSSEQTLAEGLEEYYCGHAEVVRPSLLDAETAELFRWHDLCHVIFGLDTTLEDEAMADVRTLLGCDVGWKTYLGYLRANKQANAIFKSVGVWRITASSIAATPRMIRALFVPVRKKWPWHVPEELRGRPLRELRQEFGIRVI